MEQRLVVEQIAIVERCLTRAQHHYVSAGQHLGIDITRQESILLNLQRASQATIKIARHLVRIHRLGTPHGSHDALTRLVEQELLDGGLGTRAKALADLNDRVLRDDPPCDLAFIQGILDGQIADFTEFTEAALRIGNAAAPEES